MIKVAFHRFELQLKHTFTIAHDSRDVQPIVIVELESGGFRGYGEATSNKYYNVTIEGIIDAVEKCRGTVESISDEEPAVVWSKLARVLENCPFALCALDQAYHDLYCKRKGVKLYRYWGLNIDANPVTDYTIGIADVDVMIAKMKEFPWPLYKIKLGTDRDLEIVSQLRKHTGAVFRIDANCAWSADYTLEVAPELKRLGVEFIEQPLPAADLTGMKRVFEGSVLPVIADESCIRESDVALCAGLFHGVNIKLTKCGGFTPALRMLHTARQYGMKTMIGCMNESSVGISAIAQLLPLLDYVDMDGTLLITNDPACGVTFDYGRVLYPARDGTGVELCKYID